MRVFLDLIWEPGVICFVAGVDSVKWSDLMLNASDAQWLLLVQYHFYDTETFSL